MNNEISKLYASLGFRVDWKNLRRFEKRLGDAQVNMQKRAASFQQAYQHQAKRQTAALASLERRYNKHSGNLQRMRNDYSRINTEYKKVNISLERRRRLLEDISREYLNVRDQANRAVKPVRRPSSVSSEGSSTGVGRNRRSIIAAPVGGVAGGAATAAVTAGVATAAGAWMSNEQFQRFEAIKSAFVSLEGSTEAANKKLSQMAGMADYFGQNFMSVADGYRSFANALKGSSIEDQTMRMYNNLQAYATSLGLNQQDLSGIQLAIGQIAATGRVQGDELNQLAERGISRNLLAESMGLSLEEFTKRQRSNDGILAKNILPALSKLMAERANIGGALEQRRASTQAQQNRALNAAFYANILANQSGINDYFQEFYIGLKEMVEKALPLFEELGELFESLGPETRKNLEAFGDVLGAIGNVSDSLDGVDVETPFIRLSEVLTGLSNFLNDIADTIDLMRSDSGWKEKVAGLSTMLVNQLERVTETFLNAVIDKLNILIPKQFEIGHVDFKPERIHTPNVDLSGVNALLGNVSSNLNRVSDSASKRIAPLLNKHGGTSDLHTPLFGDVVVDRERAREMLKQNMQPPEMLSKPSSNTTNYTIDAPVTISVDGYNKDPESLTQMIQENFENNMNSIIRGASTAQPNTER